MALKHVVLGLLVERRGYGHDLIGRIEERFGPGFEVTPGAVYASLRHLERDEHIEVVRRSMRGNQVRVYYAATQGGVGHFNEWMEQPLSRDPLRGEMFFRFAMANMDQVPMMRRAFEQLELECLSAMARYTRSRADDLADPVSWDAASRLLLGSAVLDRLSAELAFVRRALSVLRWAEAEGVLPRAMLLEAVSTGT